MRAGPAARPRAARGGAHVHAALAEQRADRLPDGAPPAGSRPARGPARPDRGVRTGGTRRRGDRLGSRCGRDRVLPGASPTPTSWRSRCTSRASPACWPPPQDAGVDNLWVHPGDALPVPGGAGRPRLAGRRAPLLPRPLAQAAAREATVPAAAHARAARLPARARRRAARRHGLRGVCRARPLASSPGTAGGRSSRASGRTGAPTTGSRPRDSGRAGPSPSSPAPCAEPTAAWTEARLGVGAHLGSRDRAPVGGRLVGVAGFEPAAFRSQSGRATNLRHTPRPWAPAHVIESMIGFRIPQARPLG